MANDFGFKPASNNFGFKPSIKEEKSTLEKVTDQVIDKVKAVAGGAQVFVPASNQLTAASMTARQLLSGDLNLDQISDAYSQNVKSVVQEKSRLRQEHPIATAAGTAAAGVGQTLLTGGLGNIAQAGLATGQTGATVGLEESARGASPTEALASGLKAGALGSIISTAPQALGQAKGLTSRLRARYSGLSPVERADRSIGKVLKGTSKQAQTIATEKPNISKTFAEEDLMEAGLGPKSFTPVTKIKKNIDAKVNTRGQEINSLMDELETPVSAKNISDRLRTQADEFEAIAPKANKQLVNRLRGTADEIAEQGYIDPKAAWKRRQAWDETAFKNNVIYDKSAATSMKAEEARVVRDAFQQEIKNSAALDTGIEGAETLDFLNKRFSDLKALQTVAKSGEFKSISSPLDRLTIGAVLTGARNPAIAAGFFGGREAARFLGPRTGLTGANFSKGQATISPATTTLLGSGLAPRN